MADEKDENGKPTCEYIQADGTTVTEYNNDNHRIKQLSPQIA